MMVIRVLSEKPKGCALSDFHVVADDPQANLARAAGA
jgi:hypothetical protein